MSVRAVAGEADRLGTDPAAGLQDLAPGGIPGVVVQELGESPGLVVKPRRLALRVAVHVVVAHQASGLPAHR